MTEKNTVLEKIYWLVHGESEGDLDDTTTSLASINEALASLGIRAMDLNTIHQLLNYIEDHLLDDDMADTLNTLIDAAE